MARIQSYEVKEIAAANRDYSIKEDDVSEGKNMQVVLVTSESIAALKNAYPSYFSDSQNFLKQIESVRKQLKKIAEPRGFSQKGGSIL
jgi:hypothetical protein